MSLRQSAGSRLPSVSRAGAPTNRVLVGDCLEELAKLPNASVDFLELSRRNSTLAHPRTCSRAGSRRTAGNSNGVI